MSSVNVTGSKVREDFTNVATHDLEARGLAGGEGYGMDLCQCLVNMSKHRETFSDSKWMG